MWSQGGELGSDERRDVKHHSYYARRYVYVYSSHTRETVEPHTLSRAEIKRDLKKKYGSLIKFLSSRKLTWNIFLRLFYHFHNVLYTTNITQYNIYIYIWYVKTMITLWWCFSRVFIQVIIYNIYCYVPQWTS